MRGIAFLASGLIAAGLGALSSAVAEEAKLTGRWAVSSPAPKGALNLIDISETTNGYILVDVKEDGSCGVVHASFAKPVTPEEIAGGLLWGEATDEKGDKKFARIAWEDDLLSLSVEKPADYASRVVPMIDRNYKRDGEAKCTAPSV